MPDTNPIKRLRSEVMRRGDVVGIVLNEAAIIRLFWRACCWN